MKIVNITGGLGNQMFQYAFAISLKIAYPNEGVFIDTSHYHTLFFKRFRGINLHNGYEIGKLFPKADLPVAGFRDLVKVTYYIPNYVLSRIGRKMLPQRKTEFIPSYSENYIFLHDAFVSEDRYYEGFWQCFKYYMRIKDTLREIYSHPAPNQYNRMLIDGISTGNSVGIHIRRGDYLAQPVYKNICNIEYYKKSIEKILSDELPHSFYIFSNDMEWCIENIKPLVKDNEIVFVTDNKGKDSYWDMFLMTYCKDLIIANSSFSWWGAFLNTQKGNIYAPARWLNGDYEIDLYDDTWIRI